MSEEIDIGGFARGMQAALLPVLRQLSSGLHDDGSGEPPSRPLTPDERGEMLSYCLGVVEHPGDNCSVCRGARGGVRGNENVVDGRVVCDDCSVDRPWQEVRCPYCEGSGAVRRAEGGLRKCGACNGLRKLTRERLTRIEQTRREVLGEDESAISAGDTLRVLGGSGDGT